MDVKNNRKLILSYYFFSILLIVTLRYGTLYVPTIIGALLIIGLRLSNQGKAGLGRAFTVLKYLIYSYSLYVLLITMMNGLNAKLLAYSINKVIPLILFVSLVEYFTANKEELLRVGELSAKFFVLAFIFSLALYLLGFSFMEIGPNFRMISVEQSIKEFKEIRLSWLLTHKSRYGVYCIMGLLMILKEGKFKKGFKAASIILLLLDIYLSDSMTSIFLLAAVLGYSIVESLYLHITGKNEKIKRKLKTVLCITVVCIIGLGVIYFYSKLSATRDIKTLGTRTMIWSAAIDYIKENPQGLIKIPVTFRLEGFFENAHNLILNEMIETGIIGGLLYLAVFLALGICLRKKLFYLAGFASILIAAQFDMVFYGEVPYVFWSVFALILSQHYLNIRSID